MLLPLELLESTTRFEREDIMSYPPLTRIRVYRNAPNVFGKMRETSTCYEYNMIKTSKVSPGGKRYFDRSKDARELIEQLKYYCEQKWNETKNILEGRHPTSTKKEEMFDDKS